MTASGPPAMEMCSESGGGGLRGFGGGVVVVNFLYNCDVQDVGYGLQHELWSVV